MGIVPGEEKREAEDLEGSWRSRPPDEDRVLPPLTAVFQPIVEVHDEGYRLHALEGLVRGPAGSPVESPAVLFEQVRRCGKEIEADRVCIATILRAASRIPTRAKISINVHIKTIMHDLDLPRLLRTELHAHEIDPSRLIVEIVEYSSDCVGENLAAGLAQVLRLGAKIAVDDLGAGDSNYRMILDCRPDYIKIDRYFVQNCHLDPSRRAVLESIVVLASRLGAQVVAEGVERTGELRVVSQMGINLVQGFLFGRPAPPGDLPVQGLLEGAIPPPEDASNSRPGGGPMGMKGQPSVHSPSILHPNPKRRNSA